MIKPSARPQHPHRAASALVLTTSLLLLSGCGADVEKTDGESKAVTVSRCGEKVTYQRPERAVAYEGGSADKLFALGVTNAVRGYVMPPANPAVGESPWASQYAKVSMLSDDLLNKELVVEAEADFVLAGWNSGFSEERGITPHRLDKLGIQSYMHTETCYNYGNKSVRMAPLDALYNDLTDLGRIFGAENRAKKVVGNLKGRVAKIENARPTSRRPRVFVYDSGTEQPFTAGKQTPPTDIIDVAGGRSIFADLDERWTTVGWEAVVNKQPEVIVVVDYGDKPAKDKIAFLKSSRVTKSLPAVKNNRFFVLNYNEAISGPRNVDGAEKFASYLRAIGY